MEESKGLRGTGRAAARPWRFRRSTALVMLLATSGLAALATGWSTPLVTRAADLSAGTIAFSHEVVVDNQRIAGEPSLSISPIKNKAGHHDVYISAPYGFLTTASFVWKSEDGGASFHLVAGQAPPLGKPQTCAGGGDSSIVNDKAGNLYFADLQGLTNVSASVSTDGGRSFTTTCDAASSTAVDRPWLSVYGNPLTTGREYMTVDQVAQCTLNCGLGQASTSQVGSNQVEVTETSGTNAQNQVFSPAQAIEPDGIVGGTVVNQQTGRLYISHTAYTTHKGTLVGGSDVNGTDNAVVVDTFPTGYSGTPVLPGTAVSVCRPYNAGGPCYSSTVYAAPLNQSGTSTATTGQDFSPPAIDSAGNVYVVWAQAPVNGSGVIDGPSVIYLSVSTDNGHKWSKPYDISQSVPSLQTNVFPWVAAGGRGKVDVVWYGTPALKGCSSTAGCGSSTTQGPWNVYMAQSLNLVGSNGAANPDPHFAVTKVTEYSNHYGAICTFGIGCSTGGDRGLLDFIQVQVGPSGAAYVTWADAANTNAQGSTSSAVIGFSRQVSGPGLYGGMVAGTPPAYNCSSGSASAYYSALGSETKAPASLDLVQAPTASCIAQPNAQGNYVVTMRVSSLASLAVPSTLGGPNAVWLTRWELPTPMGQRSLTNQGHIFYAAMESKSGAAPTFYAGETSTLQAASQSATQQGFMLTYPPTHQVGGTYDKTTGTITITVPAKDVGNPAGAALQLYSVTGLTATQTQASSTGGAIFNQIDATAPYDLLPSGPQPALPEAPWLPALLLVAAAVVAVPQIRRRWMTRAEKPAAGRD